MQADHSYGSKDTLSPFGRAFYHGQAPYAVLPTWAIALYNTLWQAFCTCYRNSVTILTLLVCKQVATT